MSDGEYDTDISIEEIKRRGEEAVRLQALNAWLAINKANFHKCTHVQFNEDHRGIAVNTDIMKGDVVMKIPLSCIITLEVVQQQSKIGELLRMLHCTIKSDQCYVAIFLLEERCKSNSFWAPYLAILPRHLSYMPVMFSENELTYLEGSPVLDMIMSRKERYLHDYEQICALVPEFADIATLREFTWARNIVQSRIFGFYVDKKKTSGLVPMADMVNHGMIANTSWSFSDNLDSFVLIAKTDLINGSPLLDSYGKRGHSGYFLDYGMVLDNNPIYVVQIRAEIPFEDPYRAMKGFVLGQSAETFKLATNYQKETTLQCFNFFRVAHASFTEVKMIQKTHASEIEAAAFDKTFDLKCISPISIVNELRTLFGIYNFCKESLEDYPTTLEQDQKILETDISNNIRNCIMVRLGEKLTFQFYIDLAIYVIKCCAEQDIRNDFQTTPELLADENKCAYIYGALLPLWIQATEQDNLDVKKELERKIYSKILQQS